MSLRWDAVKPGDGPGDGALQRPTPAPAGMTERIWLQSIGRLFPDRPKTVLEPDSADEALAILHADPTSVGIVVTDMTVPGDNGIALIERARGIRPGLPAILVTGFSDEPLCIPVRGGGFHILRKPVHAEELTQCINTLLALAPRSGFDDWRSLRL